MYIELCMSSPMFFCFDILNFPPFLDKNVYVISRFFWNLQIKIMLLLHSVQRFLSIYNTTISLTNNSLLPFSFHNISGLLHF
jgi:hypothetical protein